MPSAPSLDVRRKRDRQSHDPAVLHEILRDGFVAHVGIVRDGLPVVLPFLYGVGDLGDGPVLLLHGSTGAGLFLDAAGDGIPISATVTHIDGIVFARSTFDSSANYRSAMVFGRATLVPEELRELALWQVSDHLMPGRRAEVREMTRKETSATHVLQLALDRASVKVRFDGVGDAADDGDDHSSWAGVLPVALRADAAVPSAVTVAEGVRAPDASIGALARTLDERADRRAARLAALMKG